MLGPRQELKVDFTLKRFGYHNTKDVGVHILEVSYILNERKTLKKRLKITVLDVPKKAVLESVAISDDGTTGDEERDHAVYIQKIKLKGRHFLYFREFYKGKPVHAVRLGELNKSSGFAAAGEVGFRKKIYVAFPHSDKGLTYLTVNSISGTIEEKRMTDAKNTRKDTPQIQKIDRQAQNKRQRTKR